MSTPDLWTTSGHDWRKPVVLPTLRVAPRRYTSRVGAVVPDKRRRDRLAFAIRAAMGTYVMIEARIEYLFVVVLSTPKVEPTSVR